MLPSFCPGSTGCPGCTATSKIRPLTGLNTFWLNSRLCSRACWARSSAALARRLERWVAWRVAVLALPYGDQGLLIHRSLYDRVGGYRPLPLMEDVDLVRRLGRRRLTVLGAAAVTSARRWRQDGWLRRSARNLLCLTLFYAGVPAERIARLYGR